MAITKKEAKAAAKLATGKDLTKMTKAELLGTYYNEARNADIRLSNLEKLATKPGYKTATEWAYARAIKDIEHIHGEGSIRFDKNLPARMTKAQIRAAINDVRTFRASASSTKSGIDKVYKKRAETINKKYNTGLTWQEMAEILENGSFTKLDNSKGSATAWIKIGQKFKQNLKMTKKDNLKKTADKTKRVNRSDVLKETMKELNSEGIGSIEELPEKWK